MSLRATDTRRLSCTYIKQVVLSQGEETETKRRDREREREREIEKRERERERDGERGSDQQVTSKATTRQDSASCAAIVTCGGLCPGENVVIRGSLIEERLVAGDTIHVECLIFAGSSFWSETISCS